MTANARTRGFALMSSLLFAMTLIAFVATDWQGIKTVPLDRVHRLFSAGTLYTCVAGLLNALLVVPTSIFTNPSGLIRGVTVRFTPTSW